MVESWMLCKLWGGRCARIQSPLPLCYPNWTWALFGSILSVSVWAERFYLLPAFHWEMLSCPSDGVQTGEEVGWREAEEGASEGHHGLRMVVHWYDEEEVKQGVKALHAAKSPILTGWSRANWTGSSTSHWAHLKKLIHFVDDVTVGFPNKSHPCGSVIIVSTKALLWLS